MMFEAALDKVDEDVRPERVAFVRRSITLAKQMQEDKLETPQKIVDVGKSHMKNYLTFLCSTQLATQLVDAATSPAELLQKATQNIATIAAVEDGRFDEPFQEGQSMDTPIFDTTYIDFVDDFCGGGLANGELVGHAAPVGGGKTTLVLQLCWSRMNRILAPYSHVPLEEIPWHTLPRVYMFVYEPVRTLRVNLISGAAQIERSVAMNYWISGSDDKLLSSRERRDYKPHELKMLQPAIDAAAADPKRSYPNGELERLNRVKYTANKLLSLVDFSGENQQLADWAQSGVAGMRNYVESHQQKVGHPGVNIILSDYVGAMIDAEIHGDPKKRMSDRTNYIRSAPGTMIRELSAPFNCPVWAAHQLNSSENARKGGAVPDPNKADGSGMFLERCTIGVVSGKLTNENIAVYVQAKQRRGDRAAPRVVCLDKTYAMWSAQKAEGYRIVSGQVMRSDEVSSGEGRSGFIPPQMGFDA